MTHPSENDPIDSVLANLTNKYQKKSNSSAKVDNLSNDLLADIESQFKQKKNNTYNPPQKTSGVDNALESLTQQLQTKYTPKKEISADDFEEIKRKELEEQRKAKAEARRQEELAKVEAQKREALTKRAQLWLKNLNPNSDEGFWFSQFAMSYESKLQAAIDYLKALEN